MEPSGPDVQPDRIDSQGDLCTSPLKLPTPGLSKRRSSDSTVGIVDSPQLLPEGLKTDEEDYSGGRSSGAAGRGVGVMCSAEPIDLTPPAVRTEQHRGVAGGEPREVALRGEQTVAAAAMADAATTASVGFERRDEAESRSLSRSESVDDDTTRIGSFCLPGSGAGPQLVGADAGLNRGDVSAGEDAAGWDADSEALTAAETPAANIAAAFERAEIRVSMGAVGAAGPPGGTGTPGQAHGGEDLERRGSLLDVYREPEVNDWGELEDWQGLPGLEISGNGGVAGLGSRLPVRWPVPAGI